MKTATSVTGFLLIFFLFTSFTDPAKWELQKDEKGIMVYTRVRAGTDIKEVRVVNTVKASLSSIVTLLLDSKNYTEWIYSCKEAKTLKTVSPLEIYQYNLTSIPAPFQNRDMIVNLKVTQDPKTKIVTTQSISKPDYIPAVDGVERIKGYKSSYKLTPQAGGMVKVEMEMYVEPGGNVPDWLINATIIKGPFNTTAAMADQLNKPLYQKAVISSIKELN